MDGRRDRLPAPHRRGARRALHADVDAQVPAAGGRGAGGRHRLPPVRRPAGPGGGRAGSTLPADVPHQGARGAGGATASVSRCAHRRSAADRPGGVWALPGHREAGLPRLPLEELHGHRRAGARAVEGIPGRRQPDARPPGPAHLRREPHPGPDRPRLLDREGLRARDEGGPAPRRAAAAPAHAAAAELTDDEVTAMWAYLRTVPAIPNPVPTPFPEP
jgi:hypothetical protein